MDIRCLIRDSVTTIVILGVRLDFVPNQHGHAVCNVVSEDVAKYLLNFRGGQDYVKYEGPEGVSEKNELAEPPEAGFPLKPTEGDGEKEFVEPGEQDNSALKQELIDKYNAIDEKDEMEAECLKDFQFDLNKRYSVKNMRGQVFKLIEAM